MCSHAVLDDDDGGMFDRASHVGFTARMVVLARVCGVFACDDDDNTLGFNDCDKSLVVSQLCLLSSFVPPQPDPEVEML